MSRDLLRCTCGFDPPLDLASWEHRPGCPQEGVDMRPWVTTEGDDAAEPFIRESAHDGGPIDGSTGEELPQT